MKKLISIWLIALAFSAFAVGQTQKVKSGELKNLTGVQWTGTLSYLDYRKNTRVSIPSNLTVTQSKDNKLSWIFEYEYPDEPKANSKEEIALSKDGKIFDGETVIERKILADKTLRLVTEKSGPDNDKKALFRFTYLLNKKSFSIKKEVKYDGTTEFFVRNEYSWKR